MIARSQRDRRSSAPRVVFVCQALRIGGSQTVLLDLVRCAVTAGFEVIVASRGGELEASFREAGARLVRLVAREGPAHGRSGRGLRAAKTVVSLGAVARLASLCARPNVVLHASQPWPTGLAAAAALLTRTPLVWHAHGITRVEMPPAWLPLVRRMSSAWVGITPETAQGFSALDPRPGTDIRVLRNPIRLPRSQAEYAAPSPGTVGVLSTLTANKREYVRTCMQAARERATPGTPTRLVVVGDGPERGSLEDEARALEAAGPGLAIAFEGSAPEPWELLRGCEVVIGMGLVALEAASRGHRVVCASSDGLGGVLCDGSFDVLHETNFTGRGRRPLTASGLAVDLEAAVAAGTDAALGQRIGALHAATVDGWLGLWRDLTGQRALG